jgi:pyruvate/2-oxoglutarate dehydrogenase complex dihydrolipoamide dehydrogenase (E3) component
MNNKYHMIVIGAGSGGLSMALGLHQLGMKVLLIDKSDQSIGGECLNTGCVPSKAFIHASKLIQSARKARHFGLEVNGRPSMDKVWQYVKSTQNKIRAHENASFFRKQGLDVELGTARFTGQQEVEVNGKIFFGKKITIATGSKPTKLQVPGVELIKPYDNESIWDLAEIPKTILFVGAGPINMELGQAYARLGSQVLIVEKGDRILTKEPPEITEILLRQSVEMGITFYLNSKVERFTDANTAILKQQQQLQQQQHTIQFDVVVVGVGRTVNFSELNPQAAGIKLDKSGALQLDAYLRTTNKNVLAIGDAANGPKFSHAAELQATVLISNFISPLKKKVNYHKLSWVTFTDPEVATFGWNEQQLQDAGRSYEKLEYDLDEDDRAITSDYQYGKIMLYVTKSALPLADSKLLGGSIIAPHAGEMIQELILANSEGLGIKSLFNKIYPYPTASRANKTLVMNKYMDSIKPWMKKMAKLAY